MHPQEREFLASVLRYLELRGAANPGLDEVAERDALEVRLRTAAPANGPAYEERRVFRRIPTEIPSGARKDGVCGPCTVLDLSAGGVQIANKGGLELRLGDRMILSLRPGDGGLRIDIPSRVCHLVPDTDRVGLSFCGVPVVSHVRAGGTSRGDQRPSTQETPLARARLCPWDIAA